MRPNLVNTSWSAYVPLILVIVALPLTGCYTVLQKSGSYYSEFADDTEVVEERDEPIEADSVSEGYGDDGYDDTVIINRYYSGPWYDYYPYRWSLAFGYSTWPYHYGYFGWPYYGIYYNPWWNDYYYTGWCYYPRHYYGYWHGHDGWPSGDGGIRRTYTGRRTNFGGGNLGGTTSGGYGIGGSNAETGTATSSIRKEAGSGTSRKAEGTRKSARSGQKQTRIKDGGRRTGGGRNAPGNETRRDGNGGGTRKNKEINDSGRRRASKYVSNETSTGLVRFAQPSHQRSFFSTAGRDTHVRTGFSFGAPSSGRGNRSERVHR